MSQDEKQNRAVSVTALRAESYSADGDDIIISLRTKYSANEHIYSIPVECFRDLIIDLQRLNAATASTQPEQPTEQAQTLLPEISIVGDVGPSPTKLSKKTNPRRADKKRAAQEKTQSGPLTLFEEADALSGERTEVKDAHDR